MQWPYLSVHAAAMFDAVKEILSFPNAAAAQAQFLFFLLLFQT